MDKNSKIYIAGHNGMVGSAIKRNLESKGYNNIVSRSFSELNLLDERQVVGFLPKRSRNMWYSLQPKSEALWQTTHTALSLFTKT